MRILIQLFHFYADLDPAFHFNADPDPDPAPQQNNGNLQLLVSKPNANLMQGYYSTTEPVQRKVLYPG
jgi:hypothetical protein